MSSPINPVVSGLMQGFQLAHAIKGERLNQQALEQQKARDDENTAVRDLQTKMSLADRGYKPITPDQEAEAATGQSLGPAAVPGGAGSMVPGTTIDAPVKSDIKTRMATYKGDKYVRDSDAVLRARARDTAKQTTADKLDYESTLAERKQAAITKGKKQQAQDSFNVMGIPITDQMADKSGLPRGSRVMQGPNSGGALGQVLKSVNPPAPKPTAPKTFLTKEGGGRITQVAGDGKITVSDTLGLPEPAAKKTGEMTPYQQSQVDRQKKQDEAKATAAQTKAQKEAQAEVDDLDRQMQAFHSQNRAIGAALTAGSAGKATDSMVQSALVDVEPPAKGTPKVPLPKTSGKSMKVTPETAARLKAKLADNQTKIKSLFDRQHARIMQFAGGGQAAAPAVDPAAAAPATDGAQKQAAPVKHYDGEKQSYGGRDYVFTGGQWVGQKVAK